MLEFCHVNNIREFLSNYQKQKTRGYKYMYPCVKCCSQILANELVMRLQNRLLHAGIPVC